MPPCAALPPVVGTPVDQPPEQVPACATKLDSTTVGGIGHRALRRHFFGNVGLLANGTAYYLFLSLFALLALTCGIITVLGARPAVYRDDRGFEQRIPRRGACRGIDPAT